MYKKETSEDFLSIDRIEDMLLGFKKMLGYLVEDLVNKGKLNEAKGVLLRHGLQESIMEETKSKLDDVAYDPKLDPIP